MQDLSRSMYTHACARATCAITKISQELQFFSVNAIIQTPVVRTQLCAYMESALGQRGL